MSRPTSIESLQNQLRNQWSETHVATEEKKKAAPTTPFVPAHRRDFIGRDLSTGLMTSAMLHTIQSSRRYRLTAEASHAQKQIPYIDSSLLYPGSHQHPKITPLRLLARINERVTSRDPVYHGMQELANLAIGFVEYLPQQKRQPGQRSRESRAAIRVHFEDGDGRLAGEYRTLRTDNGFTCGDGKRATWVDLAYLQGSRTVIEDERTREFVLETVGGEMPSTVVASAVDLLHPTDRYSNYDSDSGSESDQQFAGSWYGDERFY